MYEIKYSAHVSIRRGPRANNKKIVIKKNGVLLLCSLSYCAQEQQKLCRLAPWRTRPCPGPIIGARHGPTTLPDRAVNGNQ